MKEQEELIIKLKQSITECLEVVNSVLSMKVEDNPTAAVDKLEKISPLLCYIANEQAKAKSLVRLKKMLIIEEEIPFKAVGERKIYIESQMIEELYLFDSIENLSKQMINDANSLRTIISWHKTDKQNTKV